MNSGLNRAALAPSSAAFWMTAAAIDEGAAALHGWGQVAAEMTRCSGVVPMAIVVDGPAVSGPALLLALADLTVMTADSYAFVNGPTTVEASSLRKSAIVRAVARAGEGSLRDSLTLLDQLIAFGGQRIADEQVAEVLDLEFSRIQFTPDLMPGDVVGTTLFNFQSNEFVLTKGPIFTELLLADEIPPSSARSARTSPRSEVKSSPREL